MDLQTVQKDDRIIVDVQQNHTVANLVRKAIWENDGEAGYDTGHPLGGDSGLVVKDDNPEEVLADAIDTAREWLDDVEGAF